MDTAPSLVDLLIIGGGPAAYTAAIYSARAQLKPIVLEGSKPGGQLMSTTYVENWPGEVSILGPDLMMKMRDHAVSMKAAFVEQQAASIDLSKRPFVVTTNKNKMYHANALIIATGAEHNRLKCPGEDKWWGKGVSVCAVCDGALYRDKKTVVVGGGDSAMEDASFLARFTDDITVVHIQDKLTASKSMQARVLANKKIKIIYNSTVTAIHGDEQGVTGCTVTNQLTKQTEELSADGIFVAIGLKPAAHLVASQLELLKSGHIKTFDGTTATSVPGVFAAGDVADMRYRQAITSAGTGCMAALDAERYLESLKSAE